MAKQKSKTLVTTAHVVWAGGSYEEALRLVEESPVYKRRQIIEDLTARIEKARASDWKTLTRDEKKDASKAYQEFRNLLWRAHLATGYLDGELVEYLTPILLGVVRHRGEGLNQDDPFAPLNEDELQAISFMRIPKRKRLRAA